MDERGGEVASSATGEDRISVLPDELLLIILLLLSNAADAARTSVLSRRWRHLWTQLPDLRVPFFPEPRSFCRAIRSRQLHLRYLKVKGYGATLESLKILLHAAARRLCGGTLVLANHALGPDPDSDPYEETPTPFGGTMPWLRMPCFEKAAEIKLDLGFHGVVMPSAGVFAQLTVLVLERVWFHSPSELIGVLSSQRCPCLQVLKIRKSRDLGYLFIDSESLQELELAYLHSLWQLKVEAAVLKKLVVASCFVKSDLIVDTVAAAPELLVSTVSAPQLVSLCWKDWLDQRSVVFGPMPHLQSIAGPSYFVYGIQEPTGGTYPADNAACLKLLHPFKAIESLDLSLIYTRTPGNYKYMMEDMKVLPNPAILYLSIHANGHSFGASTFHVLRMCPGIKKLELVLSDNIRAVAQTPCLPGCVCDEQTNWKAEELLLINLQEIQILLLRGSEHEVSFVKRLLNSATALKKMIVILSSSTTESNAKELFQMFKSLSKAEIRMELIYGNHKG